MVKFRNINATCSISKSLTSNRVVSVCLGERLRLLPPLVDGGLVLAMRGEAIIGYGKVVIILFELVTLCHLYSHLLGCVLLFDKRQILLVFPKHHVLGVLLHVGIVRLARIRNREHDTLSLNAVFVSHMPIIIF